MRNLDIWIPIWIAFLTSVLAYMGVHVTLNTPGEDAKLKWRLGFIAMAIGTCLLIGWQAWRSVHAQSQLQAQLNRIEADEEVKPVINIAPPIISIPPTPLRPSVAAEPHFKISSPGFRRAGDPTVLTPGMNSVPSSEWPYVLWAGITNIGTGSAYDVLLSAAMIDQKSKVVMRFPDISAGGEIAAGAQMPWSARVRFPSKSSPQFVVIRMVYKNSQNGGRDFTQVFCMKWMGVDNGVPDMNFTWASIEEEKELKAMMPEIMNAKPLQ